MARSGLGCIYGDTGAVSGCLEVADNGCPESDPTDAVDCHSYPAGEVPRRSASVGDRLYRISGLVSSFGVGRVDPTVAALLIPGVTLETFFLMDAEDPLNGTSFLCWKLRGLRPRTMIGPDRASQSESLAPVESVATMLSLIVKCC